MKTNVICTVFDEYCKLIEHGLMSPPTQNRLYGPIYYSAETLHTKKT